MTMHTSLRIRETLRLFILVSVLKLAFFGLALLLPWSMRPEVQAILLFRLIPLVVILVVVLPFWRGWVTGPRWLAAGLGLDVLFESLLSAPVFYERRGFWLEQLGLPDPVLNRLLEVRLVEPFFFLLVPLVLLAWAYGRRGALGGSTWAALLHAATGLWAHEQNILERGFVVGAVVRITLIYLLPLLVAALAERERRQHVELEQAHARLRRHAATVEQLAVSRERNRLARDLHDTLAHSLAALALQLEALRALLAHDPAAVRRAVDDVTALARRGLDESRRAIQALRTDPVATLGLAGTLRGLLQDFQTCTGIMAQFIVAGEESELTDEEAQAFFRIAEEALTNVERHAAAHSVVVRLAWGVDRTDLGIADDGVGFDPAAATADRYGLTGMRERAALVGATLRIESCPGHGTEVWCSLAR